jgi:serine/threonine-protein kinase
MQPGTPGRNLFSASAPWYRDITSAPIDRESDQVIRGLESRGGWGTGKLRVDFSIEVLRADGGTSMRTFETNDDFYTPDCDHMPVPVPSGGRIEAESNYACASDGDCHLIVLQGTRLYEMWRANITGGLASGGTFTGGCLAVWDLKRDYWSAGNDYGRGNHCTSADAAGLPLADLLFDADEVKAGAIEHAIRFILPNDRIRKGELVRPATHSGAGRGTPTADTVPYGARLRLKASVDLATLKPGARVVARALQKYGMVLSDGGNIALTARADVSTSAKWAGLLDAADLASLKVSDFEMVDGGPRVPVSFDCERTPLP